MIRKSERDFFGFTLSGGAKREAPAQAELRPTCAGASHVSLACDSMHDLRTREIKSSEREFRVTLSGEATLALATISPTEPLFDVIC
jgi:hypothetical protein